MSKSFGNVKPRNILGKAGGLGVGRRLAFVVRRRCKPPRVLWFLIAVCICTTQVASGQSGQLNGTVQQLSFQGPITGQPVNFSIYLPQGYASMTERLPVIYHLHGLDGTHDSPQINTVPSSYEASRTAGLIDPAIIVFPDGYGNSFWADSATTNKPAETNVIRELIPYVDANYRTIADRGSRVIQGFSMGGFGASMYAAKFPEVFSISVLYDGSLAKWSNLTTILPDVASEIFNNSEAIFNQYSPWSWSQTNASPLTAGSEFRSIVGNEPGNLNTNRAFRDHLLSLGVTPDYVETGLPHSLPQLLQAEGARSWSFIEQNLTAPVPEPSTSIMALAGLACGGYLMRRRRKRACFASSPSCRV